MKRGQFGHRHIQRDDNDSPGKEHQKLEEAALSLLNPEDERPGFQMVVRGDWIIRTLTSSMGY
jgi:hypothetical protein